jgi:beta-glucosidase
MAVIGLSPECLLAEDSQADHAAAILVKQLTLDEKLGQLMNTAPAIPRLGIPAYQWWTEALHGVVSDRDTTDFPEPIGLAATFDDKLVHDAASAISEEVRAVHANARAEGRAGGFLTGGGLDVWAPNINIFRDPRWGRGQETYGEDPFLTGRMAVAFVQGMQGQDRTQPNVIATPKHFAVHSGPEPTRHSVDVKVSAHDLEDTYLPAFRAAIVEGGAGSIMCSYNSVNGQPACANDFLLKTTLRGEWGFTGYVVSDCGALSDITQGHKFAPSTAAAVAVAFKAGVDNECAIDFLPGGNLKQRYADAVAQGLLTEADIDKALIRLFAARIKVGDIAPDGHAVASRAVPVISDAHAALALKASEESLVLLKNAKVLPWRTAPKKIVVAGPLADSIRVLRGNYSSAKTEGPVSILAGLKAQFPTTEIRRVAAGPSYTDGEQIPSSVLFTADGAPGVKAEFFRVKASDPEHPERDLMKPGGPTFETEPFESAIVRNPGADSASACSFCKAVYTGVLVAPESGSYRLGLSGLAAQLTFDGSRWPQPQAFPPSPLPILQTVHLEKGHRYPFRFEMTKIPMVGAQLVWQPIADDPAAALRDAAQDADAIVVVVGITSDLESEEARVNLPGFSGGDRTTLDLPEDQQKLLETAKATGKKLIVVALSGSALNLSWAKENADAIIQAWYPGEAGGTAVAHLLAGTVNPAGRLPVTLYRDIASLPPFDDYRMQGRTYRYFKGTPVYPFGYGLSYTTFGYGSVEIQRGKSEREGIIVRTTLTNTGTVPGDEVAQLYLRFPDVPGIPNLALRGFQRVHLAAGERRALEFRLTPRELSSVSEQGERRVLAGEYQVSVGGGQPGTATAGTTAQFKIGQTIKVRSNSN